MVFEKLEIPGLVLITPTRFNDERGTFAETWHAERYGELGIEGPFVQDNHSCSVQAGVIRGLHIQLDPAAQGKLVRVARGAIWDVAVDVRRGSPTFGKHIGVVLSADNWQQLWIPSGFLHGFCTLEPNSEVLYKTTAFYSKAAERGVVWNDPMFEIRWPVNSTNVVLSAKDRALPSFADCDWMPV